MIKLDGFGKACPLPVIMVKNEIEKKDFNKELVVIKVDNYTAVENLRKLSNSYGADMSYIEIEGGYEVSVDTSNVLGEVKTKLSKEDFIVNNKGTSYFITHETIGSGDDELGANLMQMVTYAISQLKTMPNTICLMNGGVKLATINDQTIKNLQDLEKKGVRILVCGACLNFYGLTDKLKVGEVSNAYEILDALQNESVINL